MLREEWPAGAREKDRRQPLWTGRQLRPACHATQTKGEERWRRRKVGERPREALQGGRCLLCPLAPIRIPTSQSFAVPASRATTAGFRGNPMCVVLKRSMENVEASTTCSDHRDFELTLYGNPIAWVCTARPSPAFCQLRSMQSGGRRTSFATHDRGAELRVRQSEDQQRPRREVRDH